MLERRATQWPHSESPNECCNDLAVVLTGGGARAAYQVGMLRCLAKHFPHLKIPIVTGESAGAINAAFLAAHTGSLPEAIADLSQLWGSLHIDSIFKASHTRIAGHAATSVFQMFTGIDAGGRLHGLFDTQPLHDLLRRTFPTNENGEIQGIIDNFKLRALKAVAIVTLNYTNGQTTSWVQGRSIGMWDRPSRRSVSTRLTPEHLLASSALPLVFPAVKLGATWHGDGGIRLAAPLSPALHLGARRILALSTRYDPTFAEADVPMNVGYPPAAQILGQLVDAVFLDVIDQDVQRLERLNMLLEQLPPERRYGLNPIDLLVLRPSRDLGVLAAQFGKLLPKRYRFFTRGIGSDQTSSSDFLSLLLFEPDYLCALMETGEQDAEKRLDEITALVSDGPTPVAESSTA